MHVSLAKVDACGCQRPATIPRSVHSGRQASCEHGPSECAVPICHRAHSHPENECASESAEDMPSVFIDWTRKEHRMPKPASNVCHGRECGGIRFSVHKHNTKQNVLSQPFWIGPSAEIHLRPSGRLGVRNCSRSRPKLSQLSEPRRSQTVKIKGMPVTCKVRPLSSHPTPTDSVDESLSMLCESLTVL